MCYTNILSLQSSSMQFAFFRLRRFDSMLSAARARQNSPLAILDSIELFPTFNRLRSFDSIACLLIRRHSSIFFLSRNCAPVCSLDRSALVLLHFLVSSSSSFSPSLSFLCGPIKRNISETGCQMRQLPSVLTRTERTLRSFWTLFTRRKPHRGQATAVGLLTVTFIDIKQTSDSNRFRFGRS